MPSLADPLPQLAWRNRFAALGPSFHTSVSATPLRDVHWVGRNESLAKGLGLPDHWWQEPAVLQALAGNLVLPGSQPLASVYSGHQFGVWAGQLGDGRALWLGEIDTPMGSQELQLKGAGATPYSRMGDGRAVLRSSIREFLCSEAMHGLGIPTTRALAIVGSPDKVLREELETAAVVTRVAPSFLRFGHFEHFAASGRHEELKQLADFAMAQHFPELLATPEGVERYLAMLGMVMRSTASLLAQWQSVGFCHGVMNTDNMSILGLTLDYGPFGFLDGYDPTHICNHTDRQGRYAFGRQPSVALWNLHALAQSLMPLIGDSDNALAAISIFKPVYADSMRRRLREKCGLATTQAEDAGMIDWLLKQMAYERTDHTLFFRRLAGFSTAAGADNSAVMGMFKDRKFVDAWAKSYGDRLRAEGSVDEQRAAAMKLVNPAVVLRNHLAEGAIRQARTGDFSEVNRLLKVLQNPFDDALDGTPDADAPPEWARHIAVSCSS